MEWNQCAVEAPEGIEVMIQTKTIRNQAIELARLVAAVFVVFIHCPFPGIVGGVVDRLARFAVPLFFALSGYFCYRANSKVVLKRLKRAVRLDLSATALYALWGCCQAVNEGETASGYLRWSIGLFRSFWQWMNSNESPYAIHLWYLNALVICYTIFWAYLKLFRNKPVDYGPLYMAGGLLLAVHLILQFTNGKMSVWPYLSGEKTRNALFTGLPMLAMGVFLRERGDAIRVRLRLENWKLLLLIAAGAVLSVWQGLLGGEPELPYGAVIQVFALLLLLPGCPQIATEGTLAEKCISRFGAISTAVYVLHIIVMDLYNRDFYYGLILKLGNQAEMIRPLIVASCALAAAVAWECLRGCSSRLWKKLEK